MIRQLDDITDHPITAAEDSSASAVGFREQSDLILRRAHTIGQRIEEQVRSMAGTFSGNSFAAREAGR